MSRWTGWVILAVAGVLVYSLFFTSHEAWTGSWRSTESGGLVRVNVECPAPFRVLVLGTEPEGEENRGLCDPSARTLAVEAGAVTLAAILLTWAAVTRSNPARLEPLSSKLSLAREGSPDWARGETPDGSGQADQHR